MTSACRATTVAASKSRTVGPRGASEHRQAILNERQVEYDGFTDGYGIAVTSGIPPARLAHESLHSDIGSKLRAERERQGVSLRALARQVGISPSAMSQLETGRSRPSVRTLYAIVSTLDMSLDELFATGTGQATRPVAPSNSGDREAVAPPATTGPTGPVQPRGTRKAIDLESGVRWERLTAERDPEVDFLHVVYDVGGASSRDRVFMRHAGHEYGLVLSGRLRVTTGFEPHELGPGDSISFDSSIPHLLENVGDEPVTAVWVVVGRHGDPRAARFEAEDVAPEKLAPLDGR
jgi:transcriptional regulator with XRE-family HTH domain